MKFFRPLKSMSDAELQARVDKEKRREKLLVPVIIGAGIVSLAALINPLFFLSISVSLSGILAGFVSHTRLQNAEAELAGRAIAAQGNKQQAAVMPPAPVPVQKPCEPDFNPAAAMTLERDVPAMKPLQVGHQPKQLKMDF